MKCQNESIVVFCSFLVCLLKGAFGEKCYGYEENCNVKSHQYPKAKCLELAAGWAKSLEEQTEKFYTFADFGYVKKRINELTEICTPTAATDDGFLECTDHLRFCRGRNIYMDFRPLKNRSHPIRYMMDVLGPGGMGARCQVDNKKMEKMCDHISPLQSWGPEIRYLTRMDDYTCDMVVDTPTILMKIDAGVSYYHHFCDFVNLYISLHVNRTIDVPSDTQVLIWESYPYRSIFSPAFKAVTNKPLWTLSDVMGKRVCFKNVMFPLLPRMIFGLYYNTPLVPNCEASGLFKGFSEFMLERLEIPPPTSAKKVRVTLLSRKTRYRRILNEDEIVRELTENPSLIVTKVSFDYNVPFLEQLRIISETDILIGMHGSGLTHLLFLPDWAVVFEIYNCEDAGCYYDLARLRGIKYVTWKEKMKLFPEDQGKHPTTGGPHAKFTNYAFDVAEVYSMVDDAAEYVVHHPAYTKKNQPSSAVRDEL